MAFCSVTSCVLIWRHQSFRGLIASIFSDKISADKTALCHSPNDCNLNTHHYENVKSYVITLLHFKYRMQLKNDKNRPQIQNLICDVCWNDIQSKDCSCSNFVTLKGSMLKIDYIKILRHKHCTMRNIPYFGSMFLTLNYFKITKHTCIGSWMVMEIMTRF